MVINFCIQVDPKGLPKCLSGVAPNWIISTFECLLTLDLSYILPVQPYSARFKSFVFLVVLVEFFEHRVFGELVG